jgi:ATP-binding cassette subfamily B protein
MAHYGVRVSVAKIRQLAGTDKQGTSMWGMVKALERMGFQTKGLMGTEKHLDKLPLPFIAHIEQQDGFQHYVCVYRIKTTHLQIMDPARGKIGHWTPAEFGERWSGAVVAMVPGITARELHGKSENRAKLATLLKPVWKPVLQAILTGIIYTALGLSTSLYIGKLTDHVFVTHNSGLLNLLSSVMVLISLMMVYLFAIRSVIVLKTGQVIDNQLIISYYRHLFSLPQRFFDSMKTGEIISRINDAVKIRGFINDAAIGILVNILIVLFSFFTMFILNWKLAFIMLGIIPLYIIIYLLFNSQNKRIERKAMEQAASFESQLIESLQSATHIRQLNLGAISQLKTEGRLNRLLDTIYRSGLNSITASGSTELINRLFTILLLWIGSYYVIRQQITPGNLLSFYALLGYFTGPVSGLIGANKTYQNALIAADRLFEIFHLEPEYAGGDRTLTREDFGDIVFNDVSFAYGTRGTLFRDLNLTIEAGKVTVITGPSGSGKSTISLLIQHLYPVENGSITINGYNTRYFSHSSLRALIGVVPQQIRFLTGTILENIAPGERDPDIRRIMNLLSGVGLLTCIESIPGGIESRLTENGTNLSGGERQRLAIVRALYRDPALLILDEATSSLDPVSEYHVHRYLLELKSQSRTILLISHKEQNISLADHLLVIENGQLQRIRH